MAKMQVLRGLQENIGAVNLSIGEFALARDTGKLYIGTDEGKKLLNPASSDALATARAFDITGDGTAPAVLFDGTNDVHMVFTLADIAELTAGTYTKVTVDEKGRVVAGETLVVADLPDIPASKITGLGTAAGKDIGVAGGVAALDNNGRLPAEQLPDIIDCGTF